MREEGREYEQIKNEQKKQRYMFAVGRLYMCCILIKEYR